MEAILPQNPEVAQLLRAIRYSGLSLSEATDLVCQQTAAAAMDADRESADYVFWRIAFDFTRTQARLMVALKKAGTRGLTKAAAWAALYSDRPECDWPDDNKIFDVMICNLRKKLRASDFYIRTIRAYGYVLEETQQIKAAA